MVSTLVTLVAGAGLALVILWDAFESVLVPRRIGRRIRLTRYFYLGAWFVCRAMARRIRNASRRESLLGFFPPLSQIMLLGLWASGLIVAFALLQAGARGVAGLEPMTIPTQLYLSGETFFTLGFGDITPATAFGRSLSVIEAGVGFGFLGVVIGYLPTMYAAFSQREIEISLLDARAGSPPTAVEFLRRARVHGDGTVSDALRHWEIWSAQLLENNISYPQLVYYRSQHTNQSWMATLTVILDASALLIVTDHPSKRQAELTFAMARHAMVDITQIFIHRYVPSTVDRLPAREFARLCERASNPAELSSHAVEEHLAELRRLYEPYAQALAAHLLYDLPPWIHAAPRRDNWRGGPWDKQLAATAEEIHVEDHF
ncbi:MAG TPA: potassium channel family protein [Dongiaceae bacterium]|nr:potassium channel family protein [Dongiaceae bacterium]